MLAERLSSTSTGKIRIWRVVHVVKSSIELEADMLAEVDVPEFAESSDAEYYRKLVERVIAAFHISRDNIIGIYLSR